MPEPDRPRSYPEVPAQARYPELEERVLASWESAGTFEASVQQRRDAGADEIVFYDGPPFANGLPHYGHLLTGFVKDAMPRYFTMTGRRVERRFGWDCHGLPAEVEAEKQLGVSGRGPITAYGIDAFNEHCKSSVLAYRSAWERYVTRQGRWVDFEHDYKTMDRSFMESVLWAFKSLYERGLIDEGFKVLPYCWECETPLSNFETRQDDAYRERVDPAITVAFDAVALEGEAPAGHSSEVARALAGPLRLLAWTTTPWTLPSNLALAVGPELTYALLEHDGATLVLSEERVGAYRELDEARRIGTVTGAELVGRRYRPLFPYFADTPGAFSVLAGDYVETGEGTGIVHTAPGFGEDDQRVCEAAGIAVICPVDDRGRFDASVGELEGLQVFEANPVVIEQLRAGGSLLRAEEIRHSYPHCWRTDTPLIYRAVGSYFVRATALKARMLELNQTITWVPAHVRDGSFGKWLEGVRDWPISRNRFFGSPIPIWKSDDPAYPRVDVYGSIAELEADFGVTVDDLHRPFVDELVRPNPDDPTGRSSMRRVEEVLDCWFDSGSMPFAQLHYPFEHKEQFEAHFPADFICEYIGQTRGWFFTLHVLATALFDRPAFSTCLAHGILLGDDGRKLSKRLRNFPDPETFFAATGADAMRWYLCSSPVLRGLDVLVEEQAMTEPVRQVLNPIWNCWHFLSLYGRADRTVGRRRSDQKGLLDRYVLAKTRVLCEEVTAAFERYDLASACASITAFLDALTNWYIRRSRDRFWRQNLADDADKADAYDTLHTVLEVLCRLVAPLLPFLSEEIWRGLTGGTSVHLESWPDASALPSEEELVAAMDLVREVSSAAHSLRKEHGRPARLPLRRLTFAGARAASLAPLTALLADELNVKAVELVADLGAHARRELVLVPAALGPRLGPDTQKVIAATKRGQWSKEPDGRVVAGGIALEEGEYTLALRPVTDHARVLAGEAGVVLLDLELDDELRAEGLVRGLVRVVQRARKDAGLHVTDRIRLAIALDGEVVERLEAWSGANGRGHGDATSPWRRELAAQTLADSLVLLEPDADPERSSSPSASVLGEHGPVAHRACIELPEAGQVVIEIVRLETSV